MIIEHEILEQLLDDDWPLPRVVTFLEDAGGDAWRIILRHVQEGNLSLIGGEGSTLPKWMIDEIIRTKNQKADVMVQCTDQGGRLVT